MIIINCKIEFNLVLKLILWSTKIKFLDMLSKIKKVQFTVLRLTVITLLLLILLGRDTNPL